MDRGIEGVQVTPLKIIPTDGGPVLHMLRRDFSGFSGFGEIYFSEVEPGAVKGWKRHLEMRQNFAVPKGRIKFALFDARENSSTKGMVQECLLGRPDNYRLLSLPPMVWYSFGCVGDEPALIANLTNIMHDPAESERIAIDSPAIPYRWVK